MRFSPLHFAGEVGPKGRVRDCFSSEHSVERRTTPALTLPSPASGRGVTEKKLLLDRDAQSVAHLGRRLAHDARAPSDAFDETKTRHLLPRRARPSAHLVHVDRKDDDLPH